MFRLTLEINIPTDDHAIASDIQKHMESLIKSYNLDAFSQLHNIGVDMGSHSHNYIPHSHVNAHGFMSPDLKKILDPPPEDFIEEEEMEV